jgi:LacI family gluconate utilization system Gnt-I transcriptional repressor
MGKMVRLVRRHLGRVKLEDVARAAKVSTATVSRVLNAPEVVAEPTRSKVKAVVERLGYIPDLAAGNLASDRSGQIAVIVPSFGSPAFVRMIHGVSDHLSSQGLQLVLGDTSLSGDNEARLLASLLGRRVDGIILTDIAQSAASRSLLSNAGIPVVETWTLAAKPFDMNVGFDNRAAARDATRHLIETGRRSIGMICGPLQMNQRGRDRRRGFLDAVRKAGLREAGFVELKSAVRWNDVALALEYLVENAPSLDGVFCSGDTFAASALFAAQRRGWSVPDRIAIIGLGDLDLTRQVVPSLSTAQVPSYHMGKVAAEMIARRLASEHVEPAIVDVGYEVVVRESTAPARAAPAHQRKKRALATPLSAR